MDTNEEQHRVIEYIKREKVKGYGTESIRQALVEHGYRSHYVDVLIDRALHPKTEQKGSTGGDTHIVETPAGQNPHYSEHLAFLSEDLIHLKMPGREQTLLVIIPTAFGLLGLGLFLMGLRFEYVDWALIKFSVFLVAGTLSAKAIVGYLHKKGVRDLNKDAVFEKVMRLGFIIYLLSLAMEGPLLMGFVVLGIGVMAYAIMQKAKLPVWKAIEMTSLFAFLSLGITYALILVTAVAIGIVKAKGLI